MAATIKAPKQAAKRTSKTAPPPPSIQDAVGGLDFEPPRLVSGSAALALRIPLFYIDDVEYSIAARPGVNVGLKYMHVFRNQGEYAATSYLLEKLLGAEGYQALMDYDELTATQFQQICEIAAQLALGALEVPKA
jgi:hypothetical protein